MKRLQELYEKYKVGDWPDKGSVHSYIEVYEEILEPYVATAENVLEIGLMSGESLRMWNEYFIANRVYGMDCDIKPINGLADLTQAITDGLDICIGDASNPSDIQKYFKDIKFDVVIEDAGHSVTQQVKIYNTVKPYLNKGAIYCIEDIQEIDDTRWIFETLDNDKQIEILDRRYIKQRYDDCMVIIKDK